MNADIQTLEVFATATEVAGQFVVVQDLDLMFVGGGSETGMLF